MSSDGGRIFGVGVGFPPRVGSDGRLRWSEGQANVRENIRIILLTEPGERLRRPGFGAGLRQYLFEPNNPGTRQRIRESIEDALERWEPRVSLESVVVEPDPGDAESAIATLTYRLVATQARERVSLAVQTAG
jgi:phage baseplate assembly protein W